MDLAPPPHVGLYVAFRFGYVLLGLAGAWLLWRRPRAAAAVAMLVVLNLAAWAAYVAPLDLPYGFVEHGDRSISIGNAASVAAWNSAFDHTQVRFSNLEPFWSVVAACLTLFRPERMLATYGALAPLSIVLVALSFYRGLRDVDSEDERWERALIVLAVLGLSSFSLSQRPPVPQLFAANFLLKPNHAIGWGFLGLLVGMRLRAAAWWKLGLVLGLLAWAYLLGWVYLGAGLVAGCLLQPRERRDWKRLLAALVLSGAIASPYIAHLARDYHPLGTEQTPNQIWHDQLGPRLALPHWVTLDLGPLLLLGAAGAALLWRRRTPRDRLLLGIFGSSWLLWLGYALAQALWGASPEPDEIHYFLRVNVAVAAGVALAELARRFERSRSLATGRGHAIVFGASLFLTFPAYWDPPTMDRYYKWGGAAVRRRVEQYGAWIRENTPGDAVFVAGKQACIWIPALAGRRVLLIADSRPPLDYAERKQAERILLTSKDPELIRATARRFGVDYVAIDPETLLEYGEDELEGIGRLSVYEHVFQNAAVRILKIKR
jgi:hypothetical protein